MATVLSDADARDLVHRYAARELTTKLCREYRITPPQLYRHLREAGVPKRGQPDKRKRIDLPPLIGAYLSGESMKSISDRTGHARTMLVQRFKEQGVEVRSYSDAEYLKWGKVKRDRAAVVRQCGAAWKAATGRIASPETQAQIARTVHQRLRRRGFYEDFIAGQLRDAGCGSVEQQYPVGPYNIDVALDVPRVAVEVVNGVVRSTSRPAYPERTQHLLDAGWAMVFLIIRKRILDGRAVAQQIAAFAQLVSGDESARRQYRVVRGDGEVAAPGSFEFDHFARIVSGQGTYKRSAYKRTG
jgi:very-short-patch-repair endonuclease